MFVTRNHTRLAAAASAMILTGAAQAAITDGLVAYYPLDGNAQELVNGFHGTPNGTSFIDGKVGGAASFTKSGAQYIDAVNANLFGLDYSNPPSIKDHGPTEYSYSVWFKPTASTGAGDRYILATRLAGATEKNNEGFTFSARLNNNGTALNVYAQFAVPEHITATASTSVGFIGRTGIELPTPTSDGWYHLVVTMKTGDGLYVYLNGAEVPLPPAPGGVGYSVANGSGYQVDIDSPLIASDALRIGVSQNPASPRYFDGLIDEVAVWDRVLTADEIAFLYNNGAGNALPIPEPMSLALMGAGSLLLMRRRR